MKNELLQTPRGVFGARMSGSDEQPLVLCLHGFPDDASTYDELAADLSQSGYRTVAPYLRGYDPSPLDGKLDIRTHVEDLMSVIEAAKPKGPVFFVGHDYGSQIGYAALTRFPDRFAAAVMLAGAHPAAINKNMGRLPRQWWMSRYILFFQFGKLADRAVAKDDFAYVDRLWKRWAPGFDAPAAHIRHVKQTFAKSMPGPVAMYRDGGFDIGSDPISTPTLFITGAKDRCLLPALSDGQESLFSSSYSREIWTDAGHFPHLEHPDRTAAAVSAWFANSKQVAPRAIEAEIESLKQ